MNVDEMHIKLWPKVIALCNASFYQNDTFNIDIDSNDWNSIIDLAYNHSVLPVLFNGINGLKKKIDIEAPEYIKSILSRDSLVKLRTTKELIELLQIFSQHNIPIIPYKGVVLAKKAYGDITRREFSDIDFLFNFEDFNPIKQLLINRGYKDQYVIPTWWRRWYIYNNCEYNFDKYDDNARLFHVEPHWSLGHKALQNQITIDQVLPLTKKETFLGVKDVHVLRPEGLLLTTMLHHSREKHEILSNSLDIAMILFRFQNDLDWDLLIKTASEWKSRNLLLFSVAISINFFPVTIPKNILNLIDQHVPKKTLAQAIMEVPEQMPNRFIRHWRRFWFQMEIRQFWSTKFKVIFYFFVYFVGFKFWNKLIVKD